jgi:coproporphyrinogen III oxidase-like Fe-S oxidoreductase
VKSVGDYVRRIREHGDARVWEEAPAATARLRETWWLGLRLAEGLSPGEARQRANFPGATDPLEPIAERLAADGLLVRRGDRFALSSKGLPLADWVARKFLEG